MRSVTDEGERPVLRPLVPRFPLIRPASRATFAQGGKMRPPPHARPTFQKGCSSGMPIMPVRLAR
jgi:hypothetical protein